MIIFAPSKLWRKARANGSLSSFARYVAVGGATFSLSLGLIALLVEFAGLSQASAGAVGYAASFFLNFAAARWVIFHGTGDSIFRQFLSFAVVAAALRSMEYGTYWLLITHAHLPYYLGFFVVLLLFNALKYFVYKKIVFGSRGIREGEWKKI
jgi:putative flippase GtrA